MTEKTRIVFLDVDGPLIPSYQYINNRMASYERNFSPICVNIVKMIVDPNGQWKLGVDPLEKYRDPKRHPPVKIVMNTYHNQHPTELWAALREFGLTEYMHTNWQTSYPQFNSQYGANRMYAIDGWLKVNSDTVLNDYDGDFDWIALDDENFTNDARLFLIDFDLGITVKTYNAIAADWNLRPFIIS
jgi:hypothetical protein